MPLSTEYTFCHVNMVDYQGNKSALRFRLTFANLDALNTGIAGITGAGGLLEDLEAITDLMVTSVYFGEKQSQEGYGAEGSESQEQAVISAKVANRPGVYAQIRIPGPSDDIFLPGPGADNNLVDREDVALIAFLENYEEGGVVTTSDGEHIEDASTLGNFKGRRVYRRSRQRAPSG